MSIASKLTKSVRQAKESGSNGSVISEADIFEQAAAEERKSATATSQKSAKPKANKKPEPEPPIIPFPSRRVWPD